MRVSSSSRSRACAAMTGRTALALLMLGPCFAAALSFADQAEAKTPGNTYCFYGTCHRVKSIAETEREVGEDVVLAASFYDSCKVDRYNPCGLTSSGEIFAPERPDNAASPIYPDGTKLLVWSPETQQAAVLRINNAGPYWGNRKLDVSRATADILGFRHRGVAKLQVRVVDAPNRDEATYKRNRAYDPVPGYIGQYASLDAAEAGMAALLGLEAIAASMLAPLSGEHAAAARSAPETKAKMMAAMSARRANKAKAAKAAAPKEPQLADFPAEVVRVLDSLASIFEPETPRQVAAGARNKPKSVRVQVASKKKTQKVRVAAKAKSGKKLRAKAEIASARPVKPAPQPRSTVAGPPNDNPVFARQLPGPTAGKVAGKDSGQKRAQAGSPAKRRSASLGGGWKSSGLVETPLSRAGVPLTGPAPGVRLLKDPRPSPRPIPASPLHALA